MLVRDLCEVLKSGYLLISDLSGNEISNGSIEDEEILDLEVVSIELVDIYLHVEVFQ